MDRKEVFEMTDEEFLEFINGYSERNDLGFEFILYQEKSVVYSGINEMMEIMENKLEQA